MTAVEGSADRTPVIGLLDRYLRGEFDAVVESLRGRDDFDDLLKELKREGPAWIETGGAAAREKRELAAATFALEAARLDEWNEWKILQRWRGGDRLYWKPPPLLIEWGCALFRRDPSPRPVERLWQLAALAVAERAEDFEFLRSGGAGAIVVNTGDEIDHLVHIRQRFPDEPRFKLAEAIVQEWRRQPSARKTFEQLQNDIDVGGEATVRLGVLHAGRDDDQAISLFERVESKTRDPWLIYLARFFKAQALERKKRGAEAETAYRSALAVVPLAQSASMGLASLLFRNDQRHEASAIVDAMLAGRPRPTDPLRDYIDADDRFWPVLIARLRAEIQR